MVVLLIWFLIVFCFNDTATTEIYTLSLHDALPISNPDVKFTGRMVLEGDREIPFRLLKKILYTSGQAGFINQSLAVFTKK